ncbi:MAG: hypothetical protein KDE33_28400, partial [Bacteroidetes bacterium]|nr:hypothetical protein [Bacteroidota bacterium]
FGKTNPLLNKSIGYFLVDDLKIKGFPQTTICLKILMKFPSISTMSPLNFEKNNSKNEVYKGTQYFIQIPFRISQCKEGYIFDQTLLACVKCKENYFSIDTNEKECKKCPEKAYCPGGNLIQVLENYWISSKVSLYFYKCDENKENCIGGDPFECALNYEGVLCNVCKNNSHKNLFGACIICQNTIIVVNVVFVLLLQLIIVYFCFFYCNIKRTIEKKIALKLFCDYIHLLFLSQRYNRFILKSFYENFLIRESFKWLSINCFLNLVFPDYSIYFESFSKIYFFYSGFFLLVIFNLVVKRKIFDLCLSYFYFSYPFILFEVLENLNCIYIENEYILANDPRISCSSRNYIFLLYGFLIPSILIFCCFFLLFFVYKTINKQTKNCWKTFKIIILFAVFTNIRNQLKKQNHFLRNEFFIFFEKIFLSLISALVTDEESKSLLHFLVFIISFIIFLRYYKFHYIIKRINCYL